MGQALEVLYALWRQDEISSMQGAQILQTTLCAAIDRTLWLCESNGKPDEKEFHAHLHSWQALCHILRDLHSGVNLPGVSLSAAVAYWSDAVRQSMPRRWIAARLLAH